MSQDIYTERWTGFAGLARRLSLGMTRDAREVTVGLLAPTLVWAVVSALLRPSPVTIGFLIAVSSFIAAYRSARATGQAIEALSVLRLVPATARRQWLRGWRQVQTRLGPGLAVAGCAIVALRGGEIGVALYVLGAILATQAMATWSALLFRPRAIAVKWLIWLTLAAAFGMKQPIDATPLEFWIGSALALAATVLLVIADKRLQRVAAGRELHRLPKKPGDSAITRRFADCLPQSIDGTQTVRGVLISNFMLIFFIITNSTWRVDSQWQATYGPLKLGLIYWMTVIISSSLAFRPVGWRRWLMPGGVARHRLGQQIVAYNLLLQGGQLLIGIVALSALAILFQMPPGEIVDTVLRTWPLAIEWSLVTTLSVIWAGLFSRRDPGKKQMTLSGIGLGIGIGLGWWWLDQHKLATWGTVDATYIVTLLAALTILIPVSNAVWARADLHRLMNRPPNKWLPEN